MGLTIAAGRRAIAFNKLLFPALGGPSITTLRWSKHATVRSPDTRARTVRDAETNRTAQLEHTPDAVSHNLAPSTVC